MAADTCQIHPDKITIHPHGLAKWKTVLDHVNQEISRQFHILGRGLPIGERIPYSKVVRVKLISESLGIGRPGSRNAGKGMRVSLFGFSLSRGRHRMQDKKADYYLIVAVEEGDTFKIGPIDSANIAEDVERQLRQRLGLPENF